MVSYATVGVSIQNVPQLTQPTVVQSINDELDNIFDVLNNQGAQLSRSFVPNTAYTTFYYSVLLTTPNQVVQFANNFAAGQYPGTVQATVANPQFLYISGPTAQMCTSPVDMCTYPVPSQNPADNNAEIAEVTVVNNQMLPASAGYNLVTDYPESQLVDVLATEDSHSVLDVTDCSGTNCSNTMANPVGNTNTVPTQCDLQELYVLSGGAYGCPPPPLPPPPPPPPTPAPTGSSGSGGGGGGGGDSGSGSGGGSDTYVYLLYTVTTTYDDSSDGGVSGSITEITTYYYSDGSVSVGSPKYYNYGVCSTSGY
jgi:uncharacterized membrane protein YgcG